MQMRLIDADALESKRIVERRRVFVDGRARYQNFMIEVYSIDDVRNAPTMEISGEPATRSRWVKQAGMQKTYWYECANCKTIGSPRWKRCPVCEARMERVK